MNTISKGAIAQNELIHAAFNSKAPKGLKVTEYSWEKRVSRPRRGFYRGWHD